MKPVHVKVNYSAGEQKTWNAALFPGLAKGCCFERVIVFFQMSAELDPELSLAVEGEEDLVEVLGEDETACCNVLISEPLPEHLLPRFRDGLEVGGAQHGLIEISRIK